MQTLRDLVNSQNQVQSTSDYINEDQTQKILIIMRLILVNQSLVVNITEMKKDTIDQAIGQINNAKMTYKVLINYKEIKLLQTKQLVNWVI